MIGIWRTCEASDSNGPVILHGLGESEVEGSVAFLRAKLGENAAYSEQRGR